MVFSSMTFLAFFMPIVTGLYFISKNNNIRNAVILLFSLLFYAWGEPKWILVMLLTVGVNYICGLMIDKATSKMKKIAWMSVGVILGVGFLVYFKYFGFIVDNICNVFGISNGIDTPALPIGISFYTFQVLTYTVDVYRGKVKVQKSFFTLLLYVSFFPQLIAGPIVNYKDIEGQLKERRITIDDFAEGLIRFFIGLSKKILLANTCGELLSYINVTSGISVLGAWVSAIAYTLQIYFDFSGYSDMAIGLGRMFGFHFLENFNYPYISKSVTEFWRRWHISLGAFFREYVYIPLGGNRVATCKHIRNILIVWALTGIWHGASWNFLLWGMYYGSLLVIEKFLFLRVKEKLPAILNVTLTLPFIIVGWVIFYHTNITDGIRHIGALVGVGAELADVASIYYLKHYLGFIVIAIIAALPWKNTKLGKIFNKPLVKVVLVSVIAIISIGTLIGQSYNPFLYFRF